MRKYHEELEADLRDMGWDLRDWYRPGGGRSQLTTRVLLQIIDLNLDRRTSRFWCEVLDRDPFPSLDERIVEIWESLHEKTQHPIRTAREDRKKRAELEKKKARLKRLDRARRAELAMDY